MLLSHLEESFNIKAHEVDYKNNLKLNSIFNYVQDIASNHASKLGVGFKDFSRLDLFWILSWIKIDIIKFPSFADLIKVKTWPKKKYKFYYLRDTIFTINDNDIFARAAAAWIPLKLETKRPVDLSLFNINFPFREDEHAINEYPDKIKHEVIFPFSYKRKIKYSDIDINQHVNNSRYIEFILDCFDKEHFDNNMIKSITISFTSESKFEDEVEVIIDKSSVEKAFDYIEAKNLTTEKKIFQAIVQWERKL